MIAPAKHEAEERRTRSRSPASLGRRTGAARTRSVRAAAAATRAAGGVTRATAGVTRATVTVASSRVTGSAEMKVSKASRLQEVSGGSGTPTRFRGPSSVSSVSSSWATRQNLQRTQLDADHLVKPWAPQLAHRAIHHRLRLAVNGNTPLTQQDHLISAPQVFQPGQRALSPKQHHPWAKYKPQKA